MASALSPNRSANSGSSRPAAARQDPIATVTAARAAHSSPISSNSSGSSGVIRS